MKKKIKSIRRYGLIANLDKPFCRRGVPTAVKLIEQLGGSVRVDPDTAGLVRGPVNVVTDLMDLARDVDVLLVFGGDGTMLWVGRETAGSGTPVPGRRT